MQIAFMMLLLIMTVSGAAQQPFSLRSRPARPQGPSTVAIDNCQDDLPIKIRPQPQYTPDYSVSKSFEPKPMDLMDRKRRPQVQIRRPRPQPVYYGGYGDEMLPEDAFEPEPDDIMDVCEDFGDVGDEPLDLMDTGCPQSNNRRSFNSMFGGVAKRRKNLGRRVLQSPSPSEVCKGTDGLVVVRLLSKPSEVEMVCASIDAASAVVHKGNQRFVADVIRKCAYDSEQVLVGGWFEDTGYPSLVTSPKRGQVKRMKEIDAAPVLCQR